ncbi:MAG: hypothetical protein IIA06_08060 [Proteobacteria bacterium]|nr:hypothetical protein [Pseudomonadota bacterium]
MRERRSGGIWRSRFDDSLKKHSSSYGLRVIVEDWQPDFPDFVQVQTVIDVKDAEHTITY